MTAWLFPQCLEDPGRSLSPHMSIQARVIKSLLCALEDIRGQSPVAYRKAQALGRLPETKPCLLPAGVIPYL